MNLYLGIDGGGTKTAAVLIDGHGRELGRGQGGAGNVALGTETDLQQALREAIDGVCMEAGFSPDEVRFDGVCAGMAGVSASERRRRFDTLLRSVLTSARYRIEPDYVAAFWGATRGEPGIAVIAGTGAVAYGRNAAGETCREDGLGYLLGDRGSGFHLGLSALRHAVDRLAVGSLDPLAEAILVQTGARTRDEIVQWLYGDFRPARVAALAPKVGELAEHGDPAAQGLVVEIAHCLRESVRRVNERLQLREETPIYTLGGLWSLGGLLRTEFQSPQSRSGHPAERESGRLTLASPLHDAAYGAALLASLPVEV